ncbi:MAG TPA: hypothetical protein VI358_18130 [Pseudolabrys sp.]
MTTLTVNASELYAGLGFHCQAILANISQHAAGAPFPDVRVLIAELDRMREIANALATMQSEPANQEAA